MSALHDLTHSTRMLMVLAEKPQHPERLNYERQLTAYQITWLRHPPETRAQLVAQAQTIPDLPHDAIAAAVSALEG